MSDLKKIVETVFNGGQDYFLCLSDGMIFRSRDYVTPMMQLEGGVGSWVVPGVLEAYVNLVSVICTDCDDKINSVDICVWKDSYQNKRSSFDDVDKSHHLFGCIPCKDYGVGSACGNFRKLRRGD